MINTKLFLTHRAKIQPKFNMFPNYWWNFQTIAPCKVINQFKIDSFGLFEINLFFSLQLSKYTVKPTLQRSLHSTFLRQCARLSIENNVYFGLGPPSRGHHARPLYRCTTTVPVSSFLHLCHMSPQLCWRRICENLSQNIEKTPSFGALNFAAFDDVGTFRSGKKEKTSLCEKSNSHGVSGCLFIHSDASLKLTILAPTLLNRDPKFNRLCHRTKRSVTKMLLLKGGKGGWKTWPEWTEQAHIYKLRKKSGTLDMSSGTVLLTIWKS